LYIFLTEGVFIYTFSRCLGKRAHWDRREFKKKKGRLRGTEIEEHAGRYKRHYRASPSHRWLYLSWDFDIPGRSGVPTIGLGIIAVGALTAGPSISGVVAFGHVNFKFEVILLV
jgi:hypothetical protein